MVIVSIEDAKKFINAENSRIMRVSDKEDKGTVLLSAQDLSKPQNEVLIK